MDRIRVIYHDEPPYGWWAESPDIDGWTAVAGTFDQVRQLAEEGVRFALERDDVVVEHLVPTSAT
jgi:predicted RNase H-like HicB family nuclease